MTQLVELLLLGQSIQDAELAFSGGRKEKVKLLKEKQVLALYRRYQALLAGKVEPRQRETEQYCRYCSHRQECR